MSVNVDTESGFRAGTPTLVFAGNYTRPGPGRNVYNVTADGERFLMIKNETTDATEEGPTFIIVQNWLEELKRLVPVD